MQVELKSACCSMNALLFITCPCVRPAGASKLLSNTHACAAVLLQLTPISHDHDSMQGERKLALMRHLVQVLHQSEVCGQEDVCNAFGHQVDGMVNGVPIHLSVKTDCQVPPLTVSCNSRCQHCPLTRSRVKTGQWL